MNNRRSTIAGGAIAAAGGLMLWASFTAGFVFAVGGLTLIGAGLMIAGWSWRTPPAP